MEFLKLDHLAEFPTYHGASDCRLKILMHLILIFDIDEVLVAVIFPELSPTENSFQTVV